MFNRRLLVLLVERVQDDDAPFSTAVPDALREYIKALEEDNARGSQYSEGDIVDMSEITKPNIVSKLLAELKTSNGCVIRAIAGRETFFNK